MAKTLKEKIIDTLITQKKISKEDIDGAVELQKKKNLTLEKALVAKGLINEQDKSD